jgi:hypothetical protein
MAVRGGYTMSAVILVREAPSGSQPDWVREGWVGEHLIARGKSTRNGVVGYDVSLAEGIAVIRDRKPKVAEWWDGWGFNVPNKSIFFPEEVVERVVGTSPSVVPEHNSHNAQVVKERRNRGAGHRLK